MKRYALLIGSAPLLVAAIAWGGMFPVAAAVLHHVDAFHMTLLRYALAALALVAILAAVEGRHALAFEGKGWRAFGFGALGFAGFNLLAFSGLARSRPEHGAVIMALMPMITVLLNWAVRRVRPAAFTLGAVALAFLGVFLVVTKGHPLAIGESADSLVGDLMMLGGAVCWVAYTMGAAGFPGWSPLRYSALTCLAGVGAIAVATLGALEAGVIAVPPLGAFAAVGWQLAYMVVLASVVAVVGWNVGIQRLGATNGVLFINFVPVTAFAIGMAQGRSFATVELAGAALVILALLANSIALQRPAATRRVTAAPIASRSVPCQ